MQGWDWPTSIVVVGVVVAVIQLVRIGAALDAMRVDLNIMEHRSHAHEDGLSSVWKDVSDISRDVSAIAGAVDTLERRALREEGRGL